MADFFQTGSVATLHMLGDPDIERLEMDLRRYSAERPIALVIPCHANDLKTSALHQIVSHLSKVDYLQQIVVGIDGATEAQWQQVRYLFHQLPQEVAVLWNDGSEMQNLIQLLVENDLNPGTVGKGRNMWLCFGYVLACNQARVVAVHDCDILTYTRHLLARLCYPVTHPTFGFDFCKGYSARFSNKLHGRVMRLMFTPLVQSLEGIIGAHPFLRYLNAFRYPLAGEVSLNLDIVRRMHMPMDWGIEVGMLSEVFCVTAPKAICQVELNDRYDHKHQALSARDPSKGLHKMAIDIANRIFHTIASHGVKLDRGVFDTLMGVYKEHADDSLRFYAADAQINGLTYNRCEEEEAVATFATSIRLAAAAYLADPLGAPRIPNWNSVVSALPEFPDRFRELSR